MLILEVCVSDDIVVSEVRLACIIIRTVAHDLSQTAPAHSGIGGRFSPRILNRTQDIWQPLSKTAITEQDAEEALRNMLDLCHVLWEIETGQDN